MADGPLPLSFLVVLAVSSFALPLVFLGWIRNTERLSREPWFAVLRSFAWGAVFSVLVAILLSLLLLSLLLDVAPLTELLSTRFTDPQAIVAVLVVAPLVEEASKGLPPPPRPPPPRRPAARPRGRSWPCSSWRPSSRRRRRGSASAQAVATRTCASMAWSTARPRASGSPRRRTSSTGWRSSPSRVLPRPSS